MTYKVMTCKLTKYKLTKQFVHDVTTTKMVHVKVTADKYVHEACNSVIAPILEKNDNSLTGACSVQPAKNAGLYKQGGTHFHLLSDGG
jgi:hypothetical protein